MPGGANHAAFAYSKDGKDRFTTDYPNLNLLDGTSDKDHKVTGGGWNSSVIGVYKTPKAGQEYTLSVEVPEADHDVRLELVRLNDAGDRVDGVSSKVIKSGEKDHITFTWTEPENSSATHLSANLAWADGVHEGTYSYRKAKLEEGSTATPWMPSFSEATAKDYPSYIGTYTDNDSNSQSADPEKYTWKKIE